MLLLAGALWLGLALVVPALSSGTTAAGPAADPRPATEYAATGEPLGAAEHGSGEQADADPGAAAEAATAPQGEPTAPLPRCEYADEPAPFSGYDEWQYTLLDTTYRLGADYVPPQLVSLQDALGHVAPGATLAQPGHLLRDFAAAELANMLAAAEAAGVQLAVQSAYRSYGYQQTTFDYWVQQEGEEAALRTSARAGHSEHQLGTAVDLRSRSGPPAWDLEDWATTPEGAWAVAHAHLFGFVLSYPQGAEHLSCYAYEPWHYRYVGRELAARIHDSGLTLREYLWPLR